MAEEVLFVVVLLQLGAERLPQAERIDGVFGTVFGRVLDVHTVERDLILAASDEVFNRNHLVLQKLHHLIVEAEPGLTGREHPCGYQRIDDVCGINLLLREAECAGENMQVEFRIVENEGSRPLIPELDKPRLDFVKVEIAAFVARVRESDVVGMSERNIVAFGNVAVFVGGSEAKPDDAALHRVESVGFCVDADFSRCIEFLFHLFENFFVIDTDVFGRDVGGKTCFLNFSGVAAFAVATALAVVRTVAGTVVIAYESSLARNIFEQAN